MARTLPGGAGERTVLASAHVNIYAKLEIKDSDGTWRELTNLSGHDWLERWTVEENIDDPVARGVFYLRREIGSLSLAPLMEASTINRNAALAYVPLLTAPRLARFSTATVAHGVTPVSGDYHQLFQGPIYEVDPAESDPLICVRAFDLGHLLHVTMIEADTQYGSGGAGTAVQTVMQAIINQWVLAAPPTVVTPVSPGWNILTYTQKKETVLEALRALALQIGHDIRYQYPAASDTPELRFYEPPRTKTVPDWTFGPDEYLQIPRAPLSDADVRNVAKVNYVDANGVLQSVTRTNSGSIAIFGRRYMEFTEDAASNIDTAPEAEALGDDAVADLGTPPHEHEMETVHFWPVQLHDLIRFLPNGTFYDQNQDQAVVGLRHEGQEGDGRTTLMTRGKPMGAYSDWIRRSKLGSGPDDVGPDTDLPTMQITQLTRIPTVRLNFAFSALSADQYPLKFQYKLGDDDWSPLVEASSPQEITINPPIGRPLHVQGKVVQRDAKYFIAHYQVPPRIEDADPRANDGVRRSGLGGIMRRRGLIPVDPIYNDPGTKPLLDTVAEQVTSDLRSADGRTNIISRFLSRHHSMREAMNARSRVGQEDTRVGIGGVPRSGYAIPTSSLYSRDGTLVLIDTATRQTTNDLIDPNGDPVRGSGPNLDVNTVPGSTNFTINYTVTADSFQYSIDGGSFTSVPASGFTVSRPAAGANDKTLEFRAVKGDQTISNTITIPAIDKDTVGPDLDVNTVPGTTSFTINYTVDATTFEYSIDGGSFTSVPASGFTVSRNAPGGATKTLVFRAIKEDQTVTTELTIPPQELGTLSITVNNPLFSDGSNTLDVTWSSSGMPSGTKFNVSYKQNGSDGTAGAAQDVTSTYQFTGVNGATGSGIVTVEAEYNGSIIASRSRAGTWAT